jgi:hypothetical protein
MTTDATQLSVCQRALADIGTRSTITSVDPPDGSQEAFYCSLYYGNVRDHILRAANWNFCLRTFNLQLWKALPGTPENQTAATQSGWNVTYPAPPWTYSYVYPNDCLRARSLVGQPQQVPIAPPIFSGSSGTNPPMSQRLPMARFEIAADYFDRLGNQINQTQKESGGVRLPVSPGSGYVGGDFITLAGGEGVPTVLIVLSVDSAGGVIGAESVTSGSYITTPTNPVGQLSTTGSGSGFTTNMTWVANTGGIQAVILTQQEFPVLNYTFANPPEALWDAMFEDTMVSALAARLCQALTGDKALARDKITIANANIQNARGVDGNEGLTINDHIPDWIRIRGVGGALGYEAFFYPLGPLFPVAPLV